MGEAIGQILPLAVGVALSPIPIVAVVLMLGTPRGRVNGPAFLVGWLLGLAAVGLIVLAFAGPAGAAGAEYEPATWVSSAATGIAASGISAGQQAVAYGVFAVLATLGVGIPVVLYLLLGDRSRHTLDRLEKWMSRNNAVIMAVLCLVIGVKLIGDAVGGLSS